MENFLALETPSGLMDIYVAANSGEDKLPVVMVFQEAFGVNSHIRDICRRLEKGGFLAVAPDLYHRLGRRIEVDYGDRKTFLPYMEKLTNEGLLEDIESTFKFLGDLPNADTSRVSTLGFCMGGFTSLLAATRFPLKRSVAFYGAGVVRPREGIGLIPFVQELEHVRCPVLLFFGGADASIPPSDIERIKAALQSPVKTLN